MIKKVLIIMVNVFLIFSLMGCGKGEMNEIAITTALGFDKSDEGVKVSCQVLNPHVLGRFPRQISGVTVYDEDGQTVYEAITKLSQYFQSELFLSHFQIVLISEELAQEGIEKHLNFLYSNTSSRHKFPIVITKGVKALDVIKIQTMLTLIPGVSVEKEILSAFKYYGSSREIYIDEIINDLNCQKENIVLPMVEVIGDPQKGETEDNTKKTTPDAIIKAGGLAVFRKDKLIGYLNESESIGFNILMGKLRTTVISVPMTTGGKVSIKIKKTTSKIKYHQQESMPSFTFELKIECIITEDTAGTLIRTKEYLEDLTKCAQQEITRLVQSTIQKSQNVFNCDFLGLNKHIHQKKPQYWKQLKPVYDQIYKNINIDIDLKLKVIGNKY